MNSLQVVRADLVARLRARAREIETAIFTRIQSMSEVTECTDPTYAAGMKAAVSGALTFGLETIDNSGNLSVPVPPETGRQARRAAREGVRLDTVLRRYAAGSRSLEEFIIAEADVVPRQLLYQILSELGALTDRLMESVAAEYQDELSQTKRTAQQTEHDRIVNLVESGSTVSSASIDYEFDIWHVGLVFLGQDAMPEARSFVDRLGYRSLHAVRDDETVWAWLSSLQPFRLASVEDLLLRHTPADISVAIGEPRKGLDGWRLTIQEAQVALQVMLYRHQRVTRCRDAILISAVIRDHSLATSLIETYVAPLDGRGESGQALRSTLRAYFKADRNISAAASDLGVVRQTVERRLRRVEERLGQTLNHCDAQLQVALAVEELLSTGQARRSSHARPAYAG